MTRRYKGATASPYLTPEIAVDELATPWMLCASDDTNESFNGGSYDGPWTED